MRLLTCLVIFASSICMDDHYQLTAPDESGYLHPYDDFLLEGGLPMVHIEDTSGLGKRNFSVLEEGAGSSGAGGFAEEDDAGAERAISPEQSKQTKRAKPTKNKGAAVGVSYKRAPGVCEACNTTFTKLLYHMITKHNHPSPHSCNNLSCKVGGEPKYFPALALLNKHNVSHHGQESKHKCELCNKSFPDANDLDRHNVSHHGQEGEYKCEPCNKSFSALYELDRHNVSLHGQEGEYKCEPCNRSFPNASELDRHNIRFHGQESAHKCESCAWSFPTLFELDRHEPGCKKSLEAESHEL